MQSAPPGMSTGGGGAKRVIIVPNGRPKKQRVLPRVTTPRIAERPFRAFRNALDAGGLVFPAELIANLLLALQVKRFIILTGISGTGKTRIGQALAARFRGTRRVASVPEGNSYTALVNTRRHMWEKGRLTLPAGLAAEMDGPTRRGSILTRWPGGELELRFYRSVRTGTMALRTALRRWFAHTLPEGAPFILRLEQSANGKPAVLVFELPGPQLQEVEIENSEVIAVRPDWTDHRGLLGHYNPLTEDYVSTPFLRLLLRARDEAHRAEAGKRTPIPFFAILDEMNLARVEHYFADFLSALESGEALHLHDVVEIEEGESDEGELPIPRRLHVPPNLFFIGTVNVDETTHFFSPKVLDRAFAIELDHVDLDELNGRSAVTGELDLARWDGALRPPGPLAREEWQWLTNYRGGELAAHIKTINALLVRYHRHFAYRVAGEIARFIRLAEAQAAEPEKAAWIALDLAILQKVLVKLNGTQAELEEPLNALLNFALTGDGPEAAHSDLALWKLDPVAGKVAATDESVKNAPLLPRSAAKLWRMRERLHRQGFTAWIE